MIKFLFTGAFVLGALAIIWIGQIFLGVDIFGLGVTILIGVVYAIGTVELMQFRRATTGLSHQLSQLNEPVQDLNEWLANVDPSLQNAARLRIGGERNALPAPVFTPYLVGLLVMLGLLGTFIGMVDTLNGAVAALEGDSELEAIRAGLAAPIEGLGLAFGTSVAGVAASAMLGLLSTLSRRERLKASHFLDTKAANEFRFFSAKHSQELAFQAIQDQAKALPAVAEKLTLLADNLEIMAKGIGESLLSSQTEFQSTVTQSYQSLGKSLNESLKESLVENAQLIRGSIEPMADEAMTQLKDAALNTQSQLVDSNKQQLAAMTEAAKSNSSLIQETLDAGLKQQTQSSEEVLNSVSKSVAKLMDANKQQLVAITDAAESNGSLIREALDAGLEQQTKSSKDVLDSVSESVSKMTAELHSNSQNLINDFVSTNEKLGEKQQQQAVEFSRIITEQLEKLRADQGQSESQAVERLGELEALVTKHLLALGNGLEEPMTRLIETASQTPKAAAQVIEKLRDEMSKNMERDNDLLTERTNLMTRLETLSDSIESNANDQRNAITSLIDSSAEKLSEVSNQFGDHLKSEVSKLAGAADYFASSSVEIASLGDGFNVAVTQFSESNALLIENLTRIEEALEQSNNRSDEQLNYYVAQAREIIDHNLLSHKEILDALGQKMQTSVNGGT